MNAFKASVKSLLFACKFFLFFFFRLMIINFRKEKLMIALARGSGHNVHAASHAIFTVM